MKEIKIITEEGELTNYTYGLSYETGTLRRDRNVCLKNIIEAYISALNGVRLCGFRLGMSVFFFVLVFTPRGYAPYYYEGQENN